MMSDNEIWDILKILAALLHMGNIKYKGKVIDNLDATDIPDHSNVERVAAILGVGKQSLVDALTSRTIFAQVRCQRGLLSCSCQWRQTHYGHGSHGIIQEFFSAVRFDSNFLCSVNH